eukprot:Hpha_TRINITY_DN15271_c4_g12::TRINITY_DN15271_c4_g12_i1::g.67376::m.67376
MGNSASKGDSGTGAEEEGLLNPSPEALPVPVPVGCVVGKDAEEGTKCSASEIIEVNATNGGFSALTSFLMFSSVFSVNHGTVTASIPLATGDFGEDLGSYSLGTLYALYTVSAMVVAVPLVDRIGARGTLVWGLAFNTIYVASYLLGRKTDGWVRWMAVMIGALFGGVAAGLIWPAQGLIFARASEEHALEKGQKLQRSTSLFGGLFAAVYLTIEVMCKVLSSLTQVAVCGSDWSGDFITGSCDDSSGPFDSPADASGSGSSSGGGTGRDSVIIMFTTLAVIATVLMAVVPIPLRDVGAVSDPGPWTERAVAAAKLMLRDPRVGLMAGMNVVFGTTTAFLSSYVTGVVVKESLGQSKVGYLDAIVPLTAAVLSLPLTKLQDVLNSKVPTVLLGVLSFIAVSASFTLVADPVKTLGTWSILPPMFVCFGIGRAVWEGPVKAVFADFFIEDAQAGFSNLIFQFGGSATVTFFAFPDMSARAKGWVCLVVSVWSGISFVWACFLDSKMRRTESLPESFKFVRTDSHRRSRAESVASSVKYIPEPL